VSLFGRLRRPRAKGPGATIGEGTAVNRESLDGVAPHLITIGRDCIIAPG
jgi:hypothetical protein